MNGVDEDFETRLRQHLREAAGRAPSFTRLRAPTPTPGATAPGTPGRASGFGPAGLLRRLRWLAAAAAVIVLGGGGGTWWVVHPSGGGVGPDQVNPGNGAAAGCAAMLTFEGRRYFGWGTLARTPRVVEPLGRATLPGCGDGDVPTRHTTPYSLPGVAVSTAVFADDTVWVARPLSQLRRGLPAELRDLTRPVRCDGDGTSTMSGRLTGVDKMPTGKDYTVQPPYTATFVATRGDTLPLDRYRSVTVQVRVTEDTTGSEPAVLRAALGHGRPVTVSARCRGTAFVAASLRLTG